MLICSLVGTFASFIVGLVNPRVPNKAGPDWLWMGGRDDVIRNLYFQPNGRFRRYGFPALALTMIGGSVAIFWILQRVGFFI